MEEKRRRAAALKYDSKTYSTPIVTAAGIGIIAEKIIEEAQNNEVPIVENKEIANLLTNVDIGDAIPVELYDAIAEIIAYVMDIDGDT